ncbi:CD164 sialomucin-like 2 protein isoform X2 [Engystomops pustulosus]|uniref:CD164 sialomucin-like 2 protein isoform X2 n=1 Tax=Engystomops pustulosus TaxID=76066 RepID=UPI003AFA17AC
MKYQLYIAVLLATALSLCYAGSCSHLNSCLTCIEGGHNISCEWVTCEASENSSCVAKREYSHESCKVSNNSSMCASNRPNGEGADTWKNRSESAPENNSAEPDEVSSEDSPESNTQTVFHTGSFIGGGILVILLEAIGYVVLKHLRGPGDYQTMEETPQ